MSTRHQQKVANFAAIYGMSGGPVKQTGSFRILSCFLCDAPAYLQLMRLCVCETCHNYMLHAANEDVLSKNSIMLVRSDAFDASGDERVVWTNCYPFGVQRWPGDRVFDALAFLRRVVADDEVCAALCTAIELRRGPKACKASWLMMSDLGYELPPRLDGYTIARP